MFRLGPGAEAAGFRLAAHDVIGSTSSEAMLHGRNGDEGGLWIVTRRQSAGRGRRGRSWSMLEGNFAGSVLRLFSVSPVAASTLSFVAALALSDALLKLVPQASPRLSLKWPNDVLADGAKLAGILVESEVLADGRLAAVIGFGVNVAAAPVDLPYRATALSDLGSDASAEDLFSCLSDSWLSREVQWAEGRGIQAIRKDWLQRAAGIGAPIEVQIGNETVRGIFETMDDGGRLIMVLADGSRRSISAGEVHIGTNGVVAKA